MHKLLWIIIATGCFNMAFAATESTSSAQTPATTPMPPPTTVQTTTTTTTNPTMPLPSKMATPGGFLPIKPAAGSTRVNIPSITIVNSNGSNIDASGIDWVDDYDIKSITVNHLAVTLTIKNIKITNIAVPIDGSFNLALNINNVNLEAISKIITRLNSMNDAKDNRQMQAQIMQEVNDLLPQVVTNTSNVTMREVFTTQQGDLIKDLKFNYPNTAALPKTTQELLNNMQLSLYVKIAIPLFNNYLNQIAVAMQTASQRKQNPVSPAPTTGMPNMMVMMVNQFIDDAVKKGYVVKTETDYIFNLTYEGGVMRINGKTKDQLAPGGNLPVPTPPMSPQPVPQTPKT